MAPVFTLAEATREDCPAQIVTNNAAFEDNIFRRASFPPHLAHLTTPEELLAWRLARNGKILDDPKAMSFKVIMQDEAVDSTQLVGFATWHLPCYGWNDSKETKKAETTNAEGGVSALEPEQKDNEHPACVDSAVLKELLGAQVDLRREVWGEETNWWYLASLGVHPDWHRRGVANLLLAQQLAQADKDGLFTYLEATPDGVPLYLKNGFISVAERKVINGTYTLTAMKRPPKTPS